MNELASILHLATESAPRPLALATVVSVTGSAYRRPGARMLITSEGQTAGTISGGCLESDTAERAMQVIDSGHSMLVTYDSTSSEDIIFGLGLGCNGVVQVMIEPLPRDDANGLLAFLRACHLSQQTGTIGTIFAIRPAKADCCSECPAPCLDCDGEITRFKCVQRLLHWPDGRITNTISRPTLRAAVDEVILEHSRRRIKTGECTLPAGDTARWLLEHVVPAPSLFIFGAGDDAIPVAKLALLLGWRVTVTDTRAAFANRSRFPTVDEVSSQRPSSFDTDHLANALAVVMTHSFTQDKDWLRVLLTAGLRHLSQIGPKERTRRLLDELKADGLNIDSDALNRLHYPAGLDIGAETPAEVALSLIAGMQSAITRHRGGYLYERDGPIHEPTL